MPWQNEMVRMVRYLITDIDPNNPTYDDTRLEETIAVSAQLMGTMVDFYNQSYAIDIDAVSITPDPTQGVRDDGFINLTCIQAAMLILNGELKTASAAAVKVTDGPSTIDYTQVATNKKMLYQDMADRFSRAVFQYRAGNSVAGQAILTPYTYDNLFATFLQN